MESDPNQIELHYDLPFDWVNEDDDDGEFGNNKIEWLSLLWVTSFVRSSFVVGKSNNNAVSASLFLMIVDDDSDAVGGNNNIDAAIDEFRWWKWSS